MWKKPFCSNIVKIPKFRLNKYAFLGRNHYKKLDDVFTIESLIWKNMFCWLCYKHNQVVKVSNDHRYFCTIKNEILELFSHKFDHAIVIMFWVGEVLEIFGKLYPEPNLRENTTLPKLFHMKMSDTELCILISLANMT